MLLRKESINSSMDKNREVFNSIVTNWPHVQPVKKEAVGIPQFTSQFFERRQGRSLVALEKKVNLINFQNGKIMKKVLEL